jgi:hypothetical protein
MSLPACLPACLPADIVGGQGVVFDAANKTLRAINCDNNNWGE